MSNIVIIGNGVAGITAARHLRKLSDHKITVISGETDYFFSRTALMYIYMGHMTYEHTKPYEDWFWQKNNIDLVRAWVQGIDFEKKTITLENDVMVYDTLILATGSQSNKFGWPGQDLGGVQGLFSFQDLEQMETNTQGISKAVVVGGGLIGVEMAEMLHSRHIPVTYLVREGHFWGNVLSKEESALIEQHLIKQHIDLRLSTELEEIIDNGKGHTCGVTTTSGESIACEFVGLTVGVHPNIDLVKNSGVETQRGILVDDMLQTSVPDVYAIGDCAQLRQPLPHRRGIEAVWYVGRMMGETVAQTIGGTPTPYVPGVWFNSAKFFDIEYQTYGNIPAACPDGHATFLWQNLNEEKSMRILYKKNDMVVTGVNFLGIRSRHNVWESWIKTRKTLRYVIEHLHEANFDPEFFKRWEGDIQSQYNDQHPGNTISVRKRTLLEKILGA